MIVTVFYLIAVLLHIFADKNYWTYLAYLLVSGILLFT